MIIDPAAPHNPDPATTYGPDGDLQDVRWGDVRNDTLRELYFEQGHDEGVRHAAATETAKRIATGAMTAQEAEGIDLTD